MTSIRNHVMAGVYFVLCITLIGCSPNASNVVADSPISAEATVTEVASDEVVVSEIAATPLESAKAAEIIDYGQYLNKIWVVKGWYGGGYKYPVSFFISKIEDGVIEGGVSPDGVTLPEFFFYRSEPSIYIGKFTGEINGDKAECSFSAENGNKGTLMLSFKENNEMEAGIEFTGHGEAYEDLPLEARYVFRPYNLKDIEYNIDPQKTRSIAVDLNSWGEVNLITTFSQSDKPHPSAYITNKLGEILYQFSAPFQSGTDFTDITIEDINKDGLKDIHLVSGLVDYETWQVAPADPPIEWSFLQREDGLFYDSSLSIK